MQGVQDVFLSLDFSVQLGILDPDFPMIKGARRQHFSASVSNVCETQKLLLISPSPPLKQLVDPAVKAVVHFK